MLSRTLRATALLRIDVLSDGEAAAAWLGTDPRVGDVLALGSEAGITRLEVPFDGPADEQAGLLQGMIAAGHRVSSFGQATSDLEEIFLKVTGNDEETAA